MNFGGSPRLTIAGYAVSAALFVFGAFVVGLLYLVERIFTGPDDPVPRAPGVPRPEPG